MSESWFQFSAGRWVAFALAGAVIASIQIVPAHGWSWLGNGDFAGRAVVVDGDTLDVGGQRVRLEGIDAPEMAQNCTRADGRPWDCGREAAEALTRLVDGREVTCRSEGQDKYDRTLGVCSVDGIDLNAEMVRRGLAWAFVKYSSTYVHEEGQAREARAGVWQGEAQAPWFYRENRWAVAESRAPDGCAIKGNISENGRVYHVPWSPWYGRVKVEPNRGERWFCSEAEAQKASWRSAGLR
ncbi:MAG: thermonuclease family protein [Deltaproteobacteria bacterium]